MEVSLKDNFFIQFFIGVLFGPVIIIFILAELRITGIFYPSANVSGRYFDLFRNTPFLTGSLISVIIIVAVIKYFMI